jgi:hypothetical protein
MESLHTGAAPTQTQDRKIELSLEDRLRLMELAADQRVKTQELQLARVKLDAVQALSDAEADCILARLGVPKNAMDINVDTNNGIVTFKTATGS